MTTLMAGTAAMFATRHDVFELRAGERGAAADHGDLLRDRKLLADAHHDDRRLGTRRGIAVAVGQQVRQLRRCRTTAWLLISVPAGVPGLTRRSN